MPPQQPVQQTGTQFPQPQNQMIQQKSMQPISQQYQQYYQQYPNQMQPMQQQEKKPEGILGSIKAGYDKVNEKYEMGKDVVKGMAPIAAGLAFPVVSMRARSNPAAAGILSTVGMMGMYAPRIMSAPTQAKMAVEKAKMQSYR